jgi:hypothetical protein
MTASGALEHGLSEELPRLYRYAANALMRGSKQADDLVQRTILRALEKRHNADGAGGWRATIQTRIFLMVIGIVAATLVAGAADAQTATGTGLQTVAVLVRADQRPPQARQKAADYCSNFGKTAEFQGIRQQRNGGEIALFACV